MQNEKKYIRYKGITRLPSDHDAFDGELEDVVNMSITGGELRPVLPPELIGTIPGQFIFVHKNQGYEHFIFLDGNVVKSSNYENGVITLIGDVVNIGVSSLIKVDAVGNTLIILTTEDILYALWKDGSYKTLGSQIPFPLLNFYLTSQSTISIVKTYDSYVDDLTKIKTVSGSYVNTGNRGTPIPGTSSGRTSTSRTYTEDQTAAPTAVSGNIVIGRTVYDRESIVSTDFENEIFGVINEKIAQIHEDGSLLFPFFIRYAIRLYDGTLVRHSQPFLMLPTKFIPFLAGVTSYEENMVGFYFTPSKMYFNSSMIEALQPFSDIVKSIDIFISKPVYTYVSDGQINGSVINPISSNPEKIFAGLIKSKESILEEIESVGNFFLLSSIPINAASVSASSQSIKIEGIDNIVSKEVMTDDYLSHAKIIAEHAYIYNHKLHLTGVKQKPFTGFCYSLIGDIFYEIRDYGKVKASTSHYVGPQPFLFYPSIKAAHITYFAEAHGLPTILPVPITLSEHKYLNGAFYLDPDLNPVSLSSVNSGVAPDTHFQDLQSTIFVSVHQNPFVFPASSRITLPVGRILSVASNTEAISQGQFGQFPLYAFTDDGIWALEINSDGRYVARQPVSRDVVINPNIMQMDKALAFVTGKGVTLLSGVNTEPISEIIRENNIRSSKISITGVISALETAELLTADMGTALMGAYESVPFETFSAGASLAYDYITGGGRIFVINPLYNYAYVFDLGSATWSKIIASYKRVVNNYPDCYVQDAGGVVYNLAHIPAATNTKTTCMIITRPISYEDYNFVIRSLAHRGIFKSALNVVIYASRNGVDYSPIMHRRERLIRMNGSGFKYYKLLVVAELDPNEAMSGIEIDFMVKYPNRMR